MTGRKLSIILATAALLAGLGLTVVIGLNRLGFEGQPINQYVTNVTVSDALEIKGDMTIGQTFQAPKNGLHRIEVVLRTYNRRNTHNVTFYLKEWPDSGVIYQETFNAAEVKNNRWRTFEFPPIPDSAGKTYFFYFASPDSVKGDAITVGGGEGDYYTGGQVYAGPVPANADLAFRTYYNLSAREKLSILGRRLVEDKPSIWGDIRFYLLLAALYLLLAGKAFAEIIKLAWPRT